MLVIGGRVEVQGMAWGWPTTIVSAIDDDQESPVQSHVPGLRRLVLQFQDTTNADTAASFTQAHANELIAFGQSLGEAAERLIVHCGGGIGRSPALAYGVLASLGWPYADALAEVVRVRPVAQPNALVVWRLDDALGARGEFWAVFEDWVASQDWWPYPKERLRDLPPKSVLDRICGMRDKKLR